MPIKDHNYIRRQPLSMPKVIVLTDEIYMVILQWCSHDQSKTTTLRQYKMYDVQ